MLQRPERPRTPGAGVTGGCEPPLQPQIIFLDTTHIVLIVLGMTDPNSMAHSSRLIPTGYL